MGGSALLHTIAFAAVLVVVLLVIWIALMLESGEQPHEEHRLTEPTERQETRP